MLLFQSKLFLFHLSLEFVIHENFALSGALSVFYGIFVAIKGSKGHVGLLVEFFLLQLFLYPRHFYLLLQDLGNCTLLLLFSRNTNLVEVWIFIFEVLKLFFHLNVLLFLLQKFSIKPFASIFNSNFNGALLLSPIKLRSILPCKQRHFC